MDLRATALAILMITQAAPSVSADGSTDIEEVIVTARRSLDPGLGAESLDAAEIARLLARTSDTASLLKGFPGVAVQGAGGASGLPVIRGLADDRLRVQVDGADIPSACPNHMNPPLSYIAPTAVAAIDVYAGVTPVSVGGDSIGGTIIVRSADPAFAAAGSNLLEGQAGTFYRSTDGAWGGNLAGTYATERFSAAYTGAYAKADNYRVGGNFKDYTFTGRADHALGRDEVGSSAYETANHTVRLAWQRGDHLFDFSYSYQDIAEQLYPNQRMDMTDNTASRFNLAYTGRYEWGMLQARTYFQRTEHEMDFGPDKRFWYGPGAPPAGTGGDVAVNGLPCTPISGTTMVNGQMVGCAAGMPMQADSDTVGASVTAVFPLAESGLLRTGAEYVSFRLDDYWPPSGAGMWPYPFRNINDGERDRYAVFGEWEFRQGQWSQIVGVRYEHVATDASPVHGYNTSTFPTGGNGGMGNQTRDAALFNSRSRSRGDNNWDASWIASFKASATQTYEFGLAQKTRSPNLYERYTWSSWQMAALMNNFVGDGNGYFGNVSLQPEVARTISVAAAWQDAAGESWRVRITPYYTQVSDYIDAVQWDSQNNVPRAVPVVDNFTVLRYENQDAQLYGVDFTASARFLSDDRFGVFSAGLIGSYTRGKRDDTDDDLYNVMPLNATLSITQELRGWRNTIEGEFVAAKNDVSEVRNEMQTSGYGLLHLRSRYEQNVWSVELGIENLFNRYYEHPLGGAYLGQGTTMTIPPAPNEPRWGTPVPGPGRSIYTGLTVKF